MTRTKTIKSKRIISLVLAVLLFQSQLNLIFAAEIPTPPPVPEPEKETVEAPEIPDEPEIPQSEDTQVPDEPEIPTPPPVPTPKPTPVPTPKPTPTPTPSSTPTPTQEPNSQSTTTNPTTESQTAENSTNNPSGTENTQALGNQDDSFTSDPSITTGDADSTATISNTGNQNSSTTSDDDSPSIEIVNSDNGSGSDNSGSVTVNDDSSTTQTNDADIINNLNQEAVTGGNSANKNMGDTNITTGDANVSGTIINNVNTNLDGVMVSEFNIYDDYTGDYILDFAANCIQGCGDTGNIDQTNSGNGAYSNNANVLVYDTTDQTFQQNDANIENNMVLVADSGNNDAYKNTGGDTTIKTGDANVSANIINTANNNIQGNVIVGTVNIYGDLVGDIIFPEEQLASCGSGCTSADATLANQGNGANSQNSTQLTQNTTDQTTQINNAAIGNKIDIEAETGDNTANKNTNGDSNITTGNVNTQTQVVNVANNNLDGGNMWLVLINNAGEWIGQIVGAPVGALVAASQGSDVNVDQNGIITLSNQGNGAGSANNTEATINDTNQTTQINNANIQNNLKIDANTGGNNTSANTGGSNSIQTGDVNVIDNVINFVNNNIKGGGKLVVTTVNLFGGKWLGNFRTPGQQAVTAAGQVESSQQIKGESESDLAIGGVDVLASADKVESDDQVETQATPTPTPIATLTTNTEIGVRTSAQTEYLIGEVLGQTDESNVEAVTSPQATPQTQSSADEAPTKRNIEINLAWLLGILPASLVWLVSKKLLFVA